MKRKKSTQCVSDGTRAYFSNIVVMNERVKMHETDRTFVTRTRHVKQHNFNL